MQNDQPGWWFDEFQHLGVDFDNIEEVETYSQKQGILPEDEQTLIARLGISQQDTVIEFGCGTGIFAVEAAKRCQHVYAVDISRPMLQYVQRCAEREGIKNLTPIHAGFLSYIHETDPADYIITKYAFHHLPDFWKPVALDRMANILKTQGILYIEDVIFSFSADVYEDAINQWIARMVSPARPTFTASEFETHVRAEHSTFDWIIEGLLEHNGFAIHQKRITSDEYANYLAVKR